LAEPGTLFSYLSAFVTIVLAVAFADMAASLHRLLRARKRVKWHPLPLAFALFMLLTLITLFFELWPLTRVSKITYFQLVWLLAPQFLYFLAASAVLPDTVPDDGLDLLAWYIGERHYVIGIVALAMITDLVSGVMDGWKFFVTHPDFVWSFFLPANIALFALLGVMWASRRTRVHGVALAGLFALAWVGYRSWDIRGQPAVVDKVAAAPA
jgi:hypothetical protein